MIVFRLGRPNRIEDISGTGAKLFGGRWNSPGFPVLYTSESSSLCILEVLVNSSSDYLTGAFSLAIIELDDTLSVTDLSADELPTSWNWYPHQAATQQLGNQWLANQDHPLLRVPSAVNAFEHNLLVNPALIGPEQLKILTIENFAFDQRLTL